MVKKAIIVVGLGYGDEGKGLTTDYLCLKNPNSLVVRFNGGHQAAHNVVTSEGNQHIFSNFGSGTLRNVPTYWSRYCTFEPIGFIRELRDLKYPPKIYVDEDCPVTTHYDILFNRALEATRGSLKHGSCGLGFGATIERSLTNNFLLFKDLFNQRKLISKLKLVRDYYSKKVNSETKYCFDIYSHEVEDRDFLNAVDKLNKLVLKGILLLAREKDVFSRLSETFIFEGAQGILLDQNYGCKPFVTRSNTSSQNAIEILSRQSNIIFDKEIFYVTRIYQTRHGAGPFRTDENFKLNNIYETNCFNKYQGEFKYGYLNLNKINYALECDGKFSKGIPKNLVITCLDHLNSDTVTYYKNNKLEKNHFKTIVNEFNCKFQIVKYSHSNITEHLN